MSHRPIRTQRNVSVGVVFVENAQKKTLHVARLPGPQKTQRTDLIGCWEFTAYETRLNPCRQMYS